MILDGKRIVVTGAAGRIGGAMTRRFLEEGAVVCALDSRLAELRALVVDVGAPDALVAMELDVTSDEACGYLASRLERRCGAIDVLVNCARRSFTTRFEDMSYDEWREVFCVDLDGTFLVIKSVLPLLKTSGAGRIINIGSEDVFTGNGDQCHCVAAKAGVIGLTRSLARSLGRYKITVNAITPSTPVSTKVVDLFSPESDRATSVRSRGHRGNADDAVGVAVFLASDASASTTGQLLGFDGVSTFP